MDTRTLATQLLSRLGFNENSQYSRIGVKLGDLVDSSMQAHQYHNNEHVQQATMSAYQLGRAEGLSKEDTALLVISMLGHDLAHPGVSNKVPFANERAAIATMTPIIAELSDKERTKITHTILATEPTQFEKVRERYLAADKRGSMPIQDRLSALAVESDLAASVAISVDHTRKNAYNLAQETGLAFLDTPDLQIKFGQSHGPFTKGSQRIGAVVRSKVIQDTIAANYAANPFHKTKERSKVREVSFDR